MVCTTCESRGFELAGVEAGGVVALRCDRCGRVERVVAESRPPHEGSVPRSRYRELRERAATA